jgi:hypothetical protein
VIFFGMMGFESSSRGSRNGSSSAYYSGSRTGRAGNQGPFPFSYQLLRQRDIRRYSRSVAQSSRHAQNSRQCECGIPWRGPEY